MILDKTPPVVLDHTSTPARPDPVVTRPSPGHYMLTFWAQDPATTPPGCTANCGIPETSKVTAVEWQVTAGVDQGNDFMVILGTGGLPAPTDGPVLIPLDISGGPQTNGAYPAGTQAQFRIRDGAGNWTNWNTVNIP
jgi:hypothetical protein